jgi:hypothetical protein
MKKKKKSLDYTFFFKNLDLTFISSVYKNGLKKYIVKPPSAKKKHTSVKLYDIDQTRNHGLCISCTMYEI